MKPMRHIAVLTSGGDSPGMNAATRAVVRTAIAADSDITGVLRGFTGLIAGEFVPLTARSVSNIIQTGGTVLKTSRCEEFMHPEGRERAAARIRGAGIEGLIGIGGDGTFHGLHALFVEHGIPVIGVPGTIDNDVHGTDFTIGFDTAANTALESIDKIRDTAASHDRIFFIEVMGRNCGALALEVGVAGGAEVILVPEVPVSLDSVCGALEEGHRRGKTSYIIVVAEGAHEGGAQTLADAVKGRLGIDYRVSIIGHVQRGGAPTAFDRTLASRLGRAAVEALLAGETDKMAGALCGRLVLVPLVETWEKKKPVDLDLIRLTSITSS